MPDGQSNGSDDDDARRREDDARRRQDSERLHAIQRALDELAVEHPECAMVLTLRAVHGISLEETASRLDITPRTAHLRWNFARAWINRAISDNA